MAVIHPQARSLSPFYAAASRNFWSATPEPTNLAHGFYSLPVSRMLFTPFAAMGDRWGGLAWRGLTLALFGWQAGLWAQLLTPERRARAWALILLVLAPSAAAVIRNGQFDGPTWALMSAGAAMAARQRWWASAVLIVLAVALKPTAIVAALLFGALWLPVGVRLAPLMAAALAAPFLNANWGYVEALYRAWLDSLVGALPNHAGYNDLATSLAHLGVSISYPVMTLVRIVAALLTFLLGLSARLRLTPTWATYAVLGLAAVFLLLFNPRTEGPSYVGLGLVAAPLAAYLGLTASRRGFAVALGLLAAGPALVGLTAATRAALGEWFDAALALVFLVVVLIPLALGRGLDQAPSSFAATGAK